MQREQVVRGKSPCSRFVHVAYTANALEAIRLFPNEHGLRPHSGAVHRVHPVPIFRLAATRNLQEIEDLLNVDSRGWPEPTWAVHRHRHGRSARRHLQHGVRGLHHWQRRHHRGGFHLGRHRPIDLRAGRSAIACCTPRPGATDPTSAQQRRQRRRTADTHSGCLQHGLYACTGNSYLHAICKCVRRRSLCVNLTRCLHSQ